MRAYWFVFRPTIAGSYVAVWCNGEILAIRNSYRKRWSLPAGGLHRGESPREAACRELREEVGIDTPADSLQSVGEIVSNAGHAEDHAHFFELVVTQRPAVVVDGREVVWADFVSPAALLEAGTVDVVRRYLTQDPAPPESSDQAF